MDAVFDEKKSSRMVIFFGNALKTIGDHREAGKILEQSTDKDSGYIVMQYYPESLSSGRSADYAQTDMQYGVGSIASYQGTSGVSFDGIETHFSRDIKSSLNAELKTSPDYNYSIEAVIALFNLLLLPRYDSDGNIKPPPIIWIDFGFDLFGYGKNYVSRFFLKEFNYDILSIFQTGSFINKIRAISCTLSFEETIYYEGKIDTQKRYIKGYEDTLKKEIKKMSSGIIQYRF